jgi:hypothetical protein
VEEELGARDARGRGECTNTRRASKKEALDSLQIERTNRLCGKEGFVGGGAARRGEAKKYAYEEPWNFTLPLEQDGKGLLLVLAGVRSIGWII